MRNGISQKQINQDREGPLERGSSPIYNCVKKHLFCIDLILIPQAPSTANRGPPPSRREVVSSSLREGAGGVRRLRENAYNQNLNLMILPRKNPQFPPCNRKNSKSNPSVDELQGVGWLIFYGKYGIITL